MFIPDSNAGGAASANKLPRFNASGKLAESMGGGASELAALGSDSKIPAAAAPAKAVYATGGGQALIPSDIGAQPVDATLTALAGLATGADKLAYSTGADVFAQADFTAAGRALVDDASAAAQRTTLGVVIGTDVQAFDAELAALAGLVSAADKLPYFTGAGTAAVADFSVAGRALVDDASASAQRTTLGLVIGTDVQAFDAELAALAGLASAADKLPYFTGSGTAALADLSVAGRALIDDASAAAQRTTLGVGTGDSPTFTSLTLSGDLNVTGSKVFIGGERTELADNYVNLNANYTADAAQSCGFVASFDPSASTNAIAAGGFVAGVASTSNPTVELTAAANVAAGDIIRVQGSTSNDGFYEVHAVLAAPVRAQIKGIGTVAALEDWSGNQFATEAGAGSIYKIAVSVNRCGTDGIWETGRGSAVPLTYVDSPEGFALVGAITTVDAGSAAAAGTAVTSARGDHEHAVTTGAAVALDTGSTSAEGAGAALARAAHTHAIASAAPAAIGVATASGIGASASFARADHSHQSNTAASDLTAAGVAGTIGVSGEPARADHQHKHPVFATAGTINDANDMHKTYVQADGSRDLTGSQKSAGRKLKVVAAKTAAYTLVATDEVVPFDATAAARVATLPPATGSGARFLISKEDSSANAVTITADISGTADLINGLATRALLVQYESAVLVDIATDVWRLY